MLEYKAETSSYFHTIREQTLSLFFKKGILLRPLGNVLYVIPPYCIEADELQYIYDQKFLHLRIRLKDNSNLKQLLTVIVSDHELHGKWLNTLSYLENCGARKIANCEHPTLVKEEMLKHAAEEFRHAHYLKKQIGRISSEKIEDYSPAHLLGGIASLHYLNKLDLKTSRYLYTMGLSKEAVKEVSYLLVTYAIELRAAELYPLYEAVLREMGSKVKVKSILLEEKEHLSEMEEGIRNLFRGVDYAKHVCGIEASLYNSWLKAIFINVKNFQMKQYSFTKM